MSPVPESAAIDETSLLLHAVRWLQSPRGVTFEDDAPIAVAPGTPTKTTAVPPASPAGRTKPGSPNAEESKDDLHVSPLKSTWLKPAGITTGLLEVKQPSMLADTWLYCRCKFDASEKTLSVISRNPDDGIGWTRKVVKIRCVF